MDSKRMISVARWLGAALGLAAIVAFYSLLFHANQTTVALTMLLLILFLAAKWGLRLAVVCSIFATACYNYFFLPPIGSFTVSDPQNLLAILVFLITSVVASRLSDRIRAESQQARNRQAEVEVLYSLSRGLLQSDELGQMTNAIPTAVMAATGCHSVIFYLAEGDRLYRAGLDWPSGTSQAELQKLVHATGVSTDPSGEAIIPLRTGVRPQGVLMLRGVQLSSQTLEAIGGLVSVSLTRARAVEVVTHEAVVRESERFRSSILDAVTQEMGAPLTSIRGAVGTLLAGSLDGETSRGLLTSIDEESDRMNRIIAETMELTRLETQRTNLTLAPQHLNALIQTAVDNHAELLRDREVTVRIPSSLPVVMVDTARLQRVIGHLIRNAVVFSAPGEPVFISAEMHGDSVACSIADRGMGIGEEEQAFIFDRLYKIRGRKPEHPSDGMSLAICRAVIEAHQGSISVTSQLGRGSVFTFTLPAR